MLRTDKSHAELGSDQCVTETVWQTYRDLGAAAYKAGQLDLAVKLYRAALKHTRQETNNQLRLGAVSSELALVYSQQGKHKEATSLLRQVISLYERLLGQQHPYLAALLCDLAFIYYRQGRGPYSVRMYRRAAEMLNRTMPDGCLQLNDAMKQVGSQIGIDERLRQAQLFFNNDYDGTTVVPGNFMGPLPSTSCA